LSRGGMAVLILIKKLAKFTSNCVVMNTLVYDPVPGNLITSYNCDFLHNTLSAQCMDMSASKNLATVLGIYPHEPLPDIAFHAPILPKYPATTQVENIVTLGCHQGALYSPNDTLASALSYAMISDFFVKVGTPIDHPRSPFSIDKSKLLQKCDSYALKNKDSVRYTHSHKYTLIVSSAKIPDVQFLNSYHKKLHLEATGNDVDKDGTTMTLLHFQN